MNTEEKVFRRKRRAARTHAKVRGGHPRLLVFRSLRAIYAHVIDDQAGKVICGTSSLKEKKQDKDTAKKVGAEIAKLATEKGVKEVAFDRNGYPYHGRVQALAEGAREGGLKF